MYVYDIYGIRSVKTYNNTVFLSLFSKPKSDDIYLLTNVDENKFEPIKVSAIEQDSVYSSENYSILKNSVPVEDFSGYCDVKLNYLSEWSVDDLATLQIALHDEPPFTVKLDDSMVIRNASGPVSFEAYLANHRARAKLVVDFEDLDTKRKSTKIVEFDPNYHGGNALGQYQKVVLEAPESYRNVSVRISINFDGNNQKTSGFSPYLFICDARLTQDDGFYGGISSRFSKEDEEYYWIKATTKANISKGEVSFVKSDGKIDVVMTNFFEKAWGYFDSAFYTKENSDVDFSKINPYAHYLFHGSQEFRNPNPEFSVREYYLRHPEVEAAGLDPLVHYANGGQKEHRSLGTFAEKVSEMWGRSGHPVPELNSNDVMRRAQDLMVPMHLLDSRKLAIFVIPEHDAMSGGIYSMFSIAAQARQMRRKHGFDVLMMTRPNRKGETYVRNSAFRNSETVLRFEQLSLFKEVSELQIHIPEYTTIDFVRNIAHDTLQYILLRDSVHINILNQNTRLMPEKDKFRDLRRICDSLGQSVSHHAFFGQEWSDRYQIPTLLLPAYTDLSPYPPLKFEEKEDIIIYSLDEAPYKDEVLNRLKKMGSYELIEIRGMAFDTYMDLATRCRFSVSFGEGFDGYVAQPMYQGGIGMALYTDEFFPDRSYVNFENFFSSEADMIENIVPTIRKLEKDRKRYVALNAALRAKWDELYDVEDYIARIGKLMQMEYEIYPSEKRQKTFSDD